MRLRKIPPQRPMSLTGRLKGNVALQMAPPSRPGGLTKNLSRHTLITRGFIDSHFEKLQDDGQTNTRINGFSLCLALQQVEQDLLMRLHWLHKECLLPYREERKKQGITENTQLENSLFSCIPPLLEKQHEVASTLQQINEMSIQPMKELAPTTPFQRLLEALKESMEAIESYSALMPGLLATLEAWFLDDIRSVEFFQTCEASSGGLLFSESLLLPFRHPSNYRKFFDHVIELTEANSEGFAYYLQLQERAYQLERQSCDGIGSRQVVPTSPRSYLNIFKHEEGLLYEPNRRLLRQSDVLLYRPEEHPVVNDSISLFKCFERAKFFVFSDSLVLVRDREEKGNELGCGSVLFTVELSQLVSVHDQPQTVVPFPSLNGAQSDPLQRLLRSCLLIVTLSRNILLCTNHVAEKYDLMEDLVMAFRQLSKKGAYLHLSSYPSQLTLPTDSSKALSQNYISLFGDLSIFA